MDSIAHYKILERVGESRLGEVFRARDTRVGRTVTIRIPSADIQNDQVKRDAFIADARAAMTLSHPNIAAVYEVGEENGRAFLAGEFVPGDPLNRVMSGRPINPRRAVDLAAQVGDALADAHAAEIFHGNLTAKAVVVTPKGNAKVLDFGFARWTRPDGGGGDEAGDIKALGRLYFEMLTGQQASDQKVAPTAVNKLVPPEMDAVALKDYELAVTLAADLRAVAALLEVRTEAAEKSRGLPTRSKPRRSQTPWIAAALAIVVAALAGAWWYFVRGGRL